MSEHYLSFQKLVENCCYGVGLHLESKNRHQKPTETKLEKPERLKYIQYSVAS